VTSVSDLLHRLGQVAARICYGLHARRVQPSTILRLVLRVETEKVGRALSVISSRHFLRLIDNVGKGETVLQGERLHIVEWVLSIGRDVLADTVLDVPPQHYRLGRAPYLSNEGASDGDRHQRTHGGKESGSGRATEEGLFVEECRRLKINPNAFGERAVLKLMFGALIRAARALAMMSGLSLFSVMGRWSQSGSLRRAMDC
jgi:hypothetical protein